MFTGPESIRYLVILYSVSCFCALCHPKVSLKIFIDVQENLTQFNSSLKIDKEDLSKVITDLNSKTRESTANSDMQPS